MTDFRKLAHLVEQLGDGRFQVLIDSGNTGKVKEFCDGLISAALPTTMTVGGRAYDLHGFLLGDEESVVGSVMIDRAKEMTANLGEDDGLHILEHQDEIPVVFRGKVVFVFTGWRRPGLSEGVACFGWVGDRWVRRWLWLAYVDWRGLVRVLRRK